MAQLTAVEWLESKFQKFLLYYEGNHKAEPYTIQELSKDFEEAKQMEKEHHGNTWDEAIKAHEDRGHVTARSICDFDDYYKETYTRLQNETN